MKQGIFQFQVWLKLGQWSTEGVENKSKPTFNHVPVQVIIGYPHPTHYVTLHSSGKVMKVSDYGSGELRRMYN